MALHQYSPEVYSNMDEDCSECGAKAGEPCNFADDQAFADSQYDHDCVIQETPDGMGCVRCLYA